RRTRARGPARPIFFTVRWHEPRLPDGGRSRIGVLAGRVAGSEGELPLRDTRLFSAPPARDCPRHESRGRGGARNAARGSVAMVEPMRAVVLPRGTVTFLFTDIEGSTRLLQDLGDEYAELLTRHRRRLREEFARHGGIEVDTQGDALFVAFERASDGLAAAA